MTKFKLRIHMPGNAPDFVATKFSVRSATRPAIPSCRTERTRTGSAGQTYLMSFRKRKPHPYPERLCIHECIHVTDELAKKTQQPRSRRRTHRFRPEPVPCSNKHHPTPKPAYLLETAGFLLRHAAARHRLARSRGPRSNGSARPGFLQWRAWSWHSSSRPSKRCRTAGNPRSRS
jgi:hypothetical protein